MITDKCTVGTWKTFDLLALRRENAELKEKYAKLNGLSKYWEKDEAKKNLELDVLRKECKKWRDDAERLAKLFEVMDLYKISAKWETAKKHIDEHNALIEKYKECQDN